MFGVAAALAAGTAWAAWRHAQAPSSPAAQAVTGDAGPGPEVSAPTARDEGDLMPPPARLDRSGRSRPHLDAARPAPSHRPPAPAAAPSTSARSLPRRAVTETPRPATTPAAQGPRAAGQAAPPDMQAPAGRTTAPPETASPEQGAGGRASGGAQPGPGSAGGEEGSGAAPMSSADVTPPRVLATSGMDYPGEGFHLTVRRQDLGGALVVEGTEGTVALRALVSADGVVRSVEVAASSGSPVLDRTAVEAVRRWRFAPATRDGAPIDAYVTLRIRYVVR